ncbi:hypothetical protein PDJAM_G00257260, partial [Pangasius djambal]|nr:hypothetical protein [Pangasius djambal]
MIIEVNAIVNKFLIRMNCFNCCFFFCCRCVPQQSCELFLKRMTFTNWFCPQAS